VFESATTSPSKWRCAAQAHDRENRPSDRARAREFYEKPTAERKRKLAAAVKRHYKRLRSQQLPPKLF
jgi:ribosomal protein S21